MPLERKSCGDFIALTVESHLRELGSRLGYVDRRWYVIWSLLDVGGESPSFQRSLGGKWPEAFPNLYPLCVVAAASALL